MMNIIDAEDLGMYIDDAFDLYKLKFEPITAMLVNRKIDGTYDHKETIGAFMELVRFGARKYQKEFPNSCIAMEVKREAAQDMRDRFEVEYALGNYNYLVED